MSEASSLELKATALYEQLDVDSLPTALRRNSLDYYYLSVYPGMRETEQITDDTAPQYPNEVTAAYVHLPYCTGVCDFCSYFLTTVKGDDRSPITQYLGDVTRELDFHSDRTNLNIQRIFFGGGTPSLIPPNALDSFLGTLQRKKQLSPKVMGTVELHPEFFEDVDNANQFLNTLLTYNIGRVSIGYQSADEEMLADNNRRHGNDFLNEAMDFLRSKGFLVNLDLMYGLPGLSTQQWERTLGEAIRVQPDSISSYFLFVDQGTVTHHEVKAGKIELPSHKLVQTQHLMAQLALEAAGYYELPNDFYAKLGSGIDPTTFTTDTLPSDSASLPIGAGAYGFYNSSQLFNQFSIIGYRNRVNDGESPLWRGNQLDDDVLIRRDIMFSLKNSPCINRQLFIDRYGKDPVVQFGQLFGALAGEGVIHIDDEANRVTLTRKGRLCVEEIAWLFRAQLPDQTSLVSASERRKLIKHNFAPTYIGDLSIRESRR